MKILIGLFISYTWTRNVEPWYLSLLLDCSLIQPYYLLIFCCYWYRYFSCVVLLRESNPQLISYHSNVSLTIGYEAIWLHGHYENTVCTFKQQWGVLQVFPKATFIWNEWMCSFYSQVWHKEQQQAWWIVSAFKLVTHHKCLCSVLFKIIGWRVTQSVYCIMGGEQLHILTWFSSFCHLKDDSTI